MFRKHLMAAALGMALASTFGTVQAANVSATVVTDTAVALDVVWAGGLTDSFIIPTLIYWNMPDLQVSTLLNTFTAQATAYHDSAPHSGETVPGPTFTGVATGHFGEYSFYSAMADHNDLAPVTWVSPADGITPHWDHYFFSVNSAADGNSATLHLKAVHPAVPEPESYAMLLAGLGLMGAIGRRRSRRQS